MEYISRRGNRGNIRIDPRQQCKHAGDTENKNKLWPRSKRKHHERLSASRDLDKTLDQSLKVHGLLQHRNLTLQAKDAARVKS